jgi:hypothetical protein
MASRQWRIFSKPSTTAESRWSSWLCIPIGWQVAGAFIYQDPILDNGGMQALYQDWIDNEQSLRKKQGAGPSLFKRYASQIQTLLRMLPGRADRLRLLEYGMGWGYWSRMAQAYGLDVTGFELSDERREYARAMGLGNSVPAWYRVGWYIFAYRMVVALPTGCGVGGGHPIWMRYIHSSTSIVLPAKR